MQLIIGNPIQFTELLYLLAYKEGRDKWNNVNRCVKCIYKPPFSHAGSLHTQYEYNYIHACMDKIKETLIWCLYLKGNHMFVCMHGEHGKPETLQYKAVYQQKHQ